MDLIFYIPIIIASLISGIFSEFRINSLIQIEAFGRYIRFDGDQKINEKLPLEITNGSIQIVAEGELYMPYLKLRCTAECQVGWKFKPVKDKRYLNSVFRDIWVESEMKSKSAQDGFHSKTLIINSSSTEMTGTYSCECTENPELKTELHVYWNAGDGSPLVNAGLQLLTRINRAGWTELPCGSSLADQALYIYALEEANLSDRVKVMDFMRMYDNCHGPNCEYLMESAIYTAFDNNETYKLFVPNGEFILNDKQSGFKVNITESTSNIYRLVCTSSKYYNALDWHRNNKRKDIVQILLFNGSRPFGPFMPMPGDTDSPRFRHAVTDTKNDIMECCSQSCQACLELRAYAIRNHETAELFNSLLVNGLNDDSLDAECKSISDPAVSDVAGFAVQCISDSDVRNSSTPIQRPVQNYYMPIIRKFTASGELDNRYTKFYDFFAPERARAPALARGEPVATVAVPSATVAIPPAAQPSPEYEPPLIWILLVGMAFIIILLTFGFLLLKFKQQNPEMEELRRRFYEGESKPAAERDDSNENPLVNRWNRAMALPYSRKRWEIKREEWEIGRILGGGISGVVMEGMLTDRITGHKRPIAIKKINDADFPSAATILTSFDCLIREIKVMIAIHELLNRQQRKHPNIVTFIGATTKGFRKREIYILLELCRNQNLENYLKDPSNLVHLLSSDNLTVSSLVFKWCAEIASGLQFLSENNFLHSDIAPRNILLTDEEIPVCKIADFGLSKSLYENGIYPIRPDAMLPRGAAVEAFNKGQGQPCHLTVKSDIWSYGNTLWEMFSLGANVPAGPPPRPFFCDPLTYKVIQQCWNKDPDQRPKFNLLETYFNCKYQESSVVGQSDDISLELELTSVDVADQILGNLRPSQSNTSGVEDYQILNRQDSVNTVEQPEIEMEDLLSSRSPSPSNFTLNAPEPNYESADAKEQRDFTVSCDLDSSQFESPVSVSVTGLPGSIQINISK